MHFNKQAEAVGTIRVNGTGAMNSTLSATAASDQGNGIVRLAIDDDIFVAGSTVYIESTTNYNGMRYVNAAPAGYIDIKATFVAETPAGTETVKLAIDPVGPAIFKGFHLKINTAPTTSEDFTVTIDADAGSAYDVVIYREDLSEQSVTDLVWYPEEDIIIKNKDVVRFAWTNTDGRTYGLTIFWSK